MNVPVLLRSLHPHPDRRRWPEEGPGADAETAHEVVLAEGRTASDGEADWHHEEVLQDRLRTHSIKYYNFVFG